MNNIDPQIYDDFYTNSQYLTEKYGDSNGNDINESLLNVTLVLAGARPACIIDSIRNNNELLNELLNILLEDYDLSITRLTSVEYLVYLTINKDYIEKEFKINKANALGYCYNKDDFNDINIVEFIAKSTIGSYEVKLFITAMPLHAYEEDSVQECISNQINSFDSVLSNLDFTVYIKVKHI